MVDLYAFKQKGDTTAGWAGSSIPLIERQVAVEYPTTGTPRLKICPPGASQLFGALPYTVEQVFTATEKTKLATIRSVKDYGAVGDGIIDDTAAINAAIAAMPAAGIRMYFPAGIYKVSSAINISKPGMYFGDGDCTVIKTSSASANTLNITSGQVTIQDISFDASVTKTAGYYISVQANNFRILRFAMYNFIKGFDVLPAGGATVSIENGVMFNGLAGAIGIQISGGFDISLCDILMNSAVNIGIGVSVLNSGDVEMTRLQIIHAGVGLSAFATTGTVIASIWASNCFFDTCGRGVSIIASGAGASVVRCLFVQCWFSSATTDHGMSISTASGGVVDGVDIVGSHAFLNIGNGIQVFDAGVKNVHIRDCSIAANTQSGVAIVSTGTQHFSVTNCRIGASNGLGANLVGIFIAAGTSNYIVNGNNTLGNTNANITDGGSAPKVVANNL